MSLPRAAIDRQYEEIKFSFQLETMMGRHQIDKYRATSFIPINDPINHTTRQGNDKGDGKLRKSISLATYYINK